MRSARQRHIASKRSPKVSAPRSRARRCILITGATTGLPDLVAQAFRNHGGFALGVSPAENRSEHVGRYGLPDDGADVIIYTGFGYKGRNVINVRSADIVLIIGGATGTLNEFTIAYDEGRSSACSKAAAVLPIISTRSSGSARNRALERYSSTAIQ